MPNLAGLFCLQQRKLRRVHRPLVGKIELRLAVNLVAVGRVRFATKVVTVQPERSTPERPGMFESKSAAKMQLARAMRDSGIVLFANAI